MCGPDLQQLWRRYKDHGDLDARARLISRYAYLVKITAGRVVANLPPSLERDDLIGAGAVGLVKAVDNFDASRRVKFETFAIALIRGAILEMLRRDDWVPRSVRDRMKSLERAYAQGESELGRPPTSEEIAKRLGLGPEEFDKLLLDTGRTSLLSLDDLLVGSEGSEQLHLSDVLHDDASTPPLEVEIREAKRSLAAAIGRLPERERLVISLYYYEGLTFREIGAVLGVSESRVYQLHTQAVLRMRGYLQRDTPLFH